MELIIRFLSRVLIAVYLIEAGLILTVAPWTDWWQFNFFADRLPWLRVAMTTTAMRAAVVAIGVMTASIGVIELWVALAGRFGARRSMFDTSDR